MTKSEYRAYISSEKWQQRRKEFLRGKDFCNRCGLEKGMAATAYDQGLHVHHRNYTRVGDELDQDLEAICRRCHEIETFGHSELKNFYPEDIAIINGTLSLTRKYDVDISQEQVVDFIGK